MATILGMADSKSLSARAKEHSKAGKGAATRSVKEVRSSQNTKTTMSRRKVVASGTDAQLTRSNAGSFAGVGKHTGPKARSTSTKRSKDILDTHQSPASVARLPTFDDSVCKF